MVLDLPALADKISNEKLLVLQVLVKIPLKYVQVIICRVKKAWHIQFSRVDFYISNVLALCGKIVYVHAQIGYVVIRATKDKNSVSTQVEG